MSNLPRRKVIATDVDKSAEDIFPSPEVDTPMNSVLLHDDDLLMVEYESGDYLTSTTYHKIRGRDVSRYITSHIGCKFYRLTPINIDVKITAHTVSQHST